MATAASVAAVVAAGWEAELQAVSVNTIPRASSFVKLFLIFFSSYLFSISQIPEL